jgi:spermidine/putrescine transport system permease protein
MEKQRLAARYRALLPYLLILPGLAWLAIFFLIPIFTLGQVSLQEGTFAEGFRFTWHWQNYPDVVSRFGEQFLRSFMFAGIATLLAFLIGYPLAYAIAFRAGRYKNLFLFLVILPFFTSYLIRTLAWKIILADEGFWKIILADEGFVVAALQALRLLSEDGRLLATRTSVIGGITYNFLPFMILPIYVSLEKIDKKLVEAAEDLYANSLLAFWKVVFPLSLPGVFAGSLLTFIPAVGDFVNAQLLGGPQQQMIGNVIQSRFLRVLDYPGAARFLRVLDYPGAAAMSFVLMITILLAVALYARLFGTEELMS